MNQSCDKHVIRLFYEGNEIILKLQQTIKAKANTQYPIATIDWLKKAILVGTGGIYNITSHMRECLQVYFHNVQRCRRGDLARKIVHYGVELVN